MRKQFGKIQGQNNNSQISRNTDVDAAAVAGLGAVAPDAPIAERLESLALKLKNRKLSRQSQEHDQDVAQSGESTLLLDNGQASLDAEGSLGELTSAPTLLAQAEGAVATDAAGGAGASSASGASAGASTAAGAAGAGAAAAGTVSIAGVVAGAAVVAGVAAAAGGSSSSAASAGVKGIVADGYIRGARIWIDTNNDGVKDFDTGVETDLKGEFTLPAGTPTGTIIAVGGFNVDTGLVNTLLLQAPAGSTVINPLTTLVQSYVESLKVDVNTAIDAVVNKLGITDVKNLLSYDPIAEKDLNTQKIAAQIATILTIGAGNDTSDQALILVNLVEKIAMDSGSPVELNNQDLLTALLGSVNPDLVEEIVIITTKLASATSFDDVSQGQKNGLLVIAGTSDSEIIYGTNVSDEVYGLDGNDTIFGSGGDDTISGGAGADTLKGEAGDDTLYGKDSNGDEANSVIDTATYDDASATVSWNGTAWQVLGTEGTDTLYGIEKVVIDGKTTWLVDTNTGNGGLSTIAEALKLAKNGDFILSTDGTTVTTLSVSVANGSVKVYAADGTLKGTYFNTQNNADAITQAIAAAADGDIIVVGPGTYAGATINKQVTITGTGNSNNTESNTVVTGTFLVHASNVTLQDLYVNAASQTNGVRIENGDYSNIELNGVTVTGATSQGVEIHNGVTMTGLTILNSTLSGNGGAGVRTASDAKIIGLTVDGSTFADNATSGIYTAGTGNSGFVITNSTFTNNGAPRTSGTGTNSDLYVEGYSGASMTLTNLDFTSEDKGAIFVQGAGQAASGLVFTGIEITSDTSGGAGAFRAVKLENFAADPDPTHTGSFDSLLAGVKVVSGTPTYFAELSGATSGTVPDTITGTETNVSTGAGSDYLRGMGGDDILIGLSGNDKLEGGAGADKFFLDNSGTATNWNAGIDVISDFGTGGRNTVSNTTAGTVITINGDVIMLSHADLSAMTGYALESIAYTVPTGNGSVTLSSNANIAQGAGVVAATSATTQFIYNSTNGALFYDADGNGSNAAAVQIATIGTGLTLTATDFLIIV